MSTTDQGFNFRATSGYVTDDADQTYVLGYGDAYPTTRSGWTFGWVASVVTRDRNNTYPARFAGCNYRQNNWPVRRFTVDLPSSGDWDIHAALGDTFALTQNIKFYDNTTNFATYTAVSLNGSEYMDATGVVRTSRSDWDTNEAALTRTFGSTKFHLDINYTGAGASQSGISHLRLVDAGGGGGSTMRIVFMV